MPKRNFSDISQSDWIRACKKLGLRVETKRGKGSHCLVINPITKSKYTIQRKLHKFINLKIFKKMIEWNFEEEKIWDALN